MTDSIENQRRRINYKKLASRPPEPLIPTVKEALLVANVGMVGNIIDGLLPLTVQRALRKMFPGNGTFQRLQALNDYRQEHNIPVSRLPL